MLIEDSSCPQCCLSLIKSKKLDEYASSCFKTVIEKIKYPSIWIFTFDFVVSDDANTNYLFLKNKQDKILNYLKYDINIDNKSYKLAAIFNMPSYNHYSSSIINSLYDTEYAKKNYNYYNDAKADNSNIYLE